KKVWLCQLEQEILSLGSVLHPGPKLLAASGKSRPVQQIEISLGQLDEADDAIDRAVAGAKIQGTGAFFFNLDGQILAAGNIRVLRIRFDFGKVSQVIEALLARIDPDGVVNVTRHNQHFA